MRDADFQKLLMLADATWRDAIAAEDRAREALKLAQAAKLNATLLAGFVRDLAKTVKPDEGAA